MALTNFYMRTGGANTNSGSSNADAAAVTSTNGSWDVTADTFIATGGTPFSGVTANVDYAAIYADGGTTAPYIALITSVNLSGLSITLSTTNKFGTKPASGATGKSCKVGGAWASLGMTASGVALNTGTVPVGCKFYVQKGTYANTTTDRTLTLAGTALLPLIWEGFDTTPGDLLADNTLTKPVWSWTTARLNLVGVHQTFRCLSITGAYTSSSQVRTAGGATHAVFERCRIEATGANAASSAVELIDGCVALDCYLKATATATRAVSVAPGVALTTSGAFVSGCTVRGGINGIGMPTGQFGSLSVSNTVIISPAGHGIELESGSSCRIFSARNVVVYNTASAKDGIKLTALPVIGEIAFCYFHTIGGYGVNNASGANTDVVRVYRNTYYANTTANTNGFGDYPAFRDIGTDAVDGFPSAGSSDFTLVSTSSAKGIGGGAAFENETFQNYLDGGAAQRQESGGAAGMLFIPNGEGT